MTICPNCGNRIDHDFQYCGECGEKVEYCGSCGNANLLTSDFCHTCGTELHPPPALNREPVTALTEATKGSQHSRTGPSGIAVGAALLLIVLLMVGYFLVATRPSEIATSQQPTEEESTSQAPLYTRVHVQINAPNCQWNRDPTTDLPRCQIDLSYSVGNSGTMTADARVTVTVDSVPQSNDEFDLRPGASNPGSLSLSFGYDTTHNVEISASAQDSQDSQTASIDATLPRNPDDPKILALYVTPNDPVIRAVVTNALSNPAYASAKWLGLSYWVQDNIHYSGSATYWQLPRETLQKKTGVCKEYSTLLVSLLRTVGYPADRVFVVLGSKAGEPNGHAWVRINLDVIGWQELEPQAGVFGIFEGYSEVRSGWTAKYIFNDQVGYTLSSVIETPITALRPVVWSAFQDAPSSFCCESSSTLVEVGTRSVLGSVWTTVPSDLEGTSQWQTWHRISHSIL